MNDHDDVREQLELGAVQPGGLDRLIAGDTHEAAWVAGHLAGCPACMQEFARLRRTAALVREAIATQPSPELRDRTLALVAGVGRPSSRRGAVRARRTADAAGDGGAVAAVAASTGLGAVAGGGAGEGRGTVDAPAVPAAVSRLRPEGAGVRPSRGILGWAAAAAVLVLAVGLTWAVVSLQGAEASRAQSREIAALAQLTAWQLRIDARDDAQRVLLAADDAGDGEAVGSLAFSPGSRELVVTATGLEPPGTGREYRCWVVVDGERERLGKMYFAADVAYWVGRVEVLDRVLPGATFGVSVAEADAPGVSSEPALTGTL